MFNYKIVPVVRSNMANDIEARIIAGEHWEFIDSTVHESSIDPNDKNVINSSQFVHLMYGDNGPCSVMYNEIAKPILWMLEEKTGLEVTRPQRIKANLLTINGSSTDNYNPPHIDLPDETYLSMVYYVNDSDGDTRIFNNTVEQGFYDMEMIYSNTPVKGTAIIFPSIRFHCSSNPIKHNARAVINFVFAVTNTSLEKFLQK